ncbi:hypothetical protein SDC9_128217 [bioreactor metagenome]|uniref:Uncharacterized protein n=1 Tax=bioreactor metagenome TaxID=1076179 RepID=A0A645CWC7_9ZZZZ
MLTTVKVIPARGSREIDISFTCTIFIYRTSHHRWSKHILITNIIHLGIFTKIHYQGPHDGIIVEISHSCQGVNIRHQTITQLSIINNRLIGRVPFGSNVPYLSIGELSVSTEQRTKCSKLIPTRVQFSPFFVISILFSGGVKFILSFLITFFYTKATNIHRPIRDATH